VVAATIKELPPDRGQIFRYEVEAASEVITVDATKLYKTHPDMELS
jgi:hypothetical protein